MKPIDLLKRFGESDLHPEEEAEFNRELSAAYLMDEAAATNRGIQRIAEKVQAQLRASDPIKPSIKTMQPDGR